MPHMEAIASQDLATDDIYDPAEQDSVLTEAERESVALRLRSIAMQLDRGQWRRAEVGLRDLINTLLSDACTTLSDDGDPCRVGIAKLGLETAIRTYLEEAGVETLHDLDCVGDAFLVASRGVSADQLRKIRAAQRRWRAGRPELCRLARLKLRGTKFAAKYKTP